MSDLSRFFGLDVHKHYLIATAVDDDLNKVYGPRRVELSQIDAWAQNTITQDDALVLEMTANAWHIHDELKPYAQSVIVVHSPHVALITRSRVKTDKIAALNLARLLAKGLLEGIWVPPQETRDLRTLVVQRQKMVRFKTQAKCRLRSTLHRYHILPPQKGLFCPDKLDWWLQLPVSDLERVRIQSDLDTLSFAEGQIAMLENCLAAWAARDLQVPFLVQISGVALITAATVLAAIGDISRFPEPRYLVGYSGLGASIHASGLTSTTGRITKSGRRELRTAMVEAVHTAVIHDPRWRAEMQRLAPRIGHKKAVLAIARKMLVVVWHVLTKQEPDRLADPQRVARKFLEFAYRIGKNNRAGTAPEYVRAKLDQIGFGQAVAFIQSGRKRISLPPSASFQS